MKLTVVGLGKIGLPLALQFAGRGHHVLGADIDQDVIDAVGRAQPPFPGEAELPERLARAVEDGTLEATTDTVAAVSASEAVVVVVPLYVDATGNPEYSAIDAATEAVGRGLRPGTLVTYETTLPVGTTRERLAPALERASGLRAGREFFLAFSPERVSSGRVFSDLAAYPKLVGGLDEDSAGRAVAFYRAGLEFAERTDLRRPNGVWDVGSAEAAEFAKLAETTYRDVNIGLSNQFALHADRIGVDFRTVVEACNSQPFSHLHQPGIAVGGHCIPVYPWFYLAGDPEASIVRAARAANSEMPERAVDVLDRVHGGLSGADVVVLGACYRGGVRETAFSGVFATVEALRRRGARPHVHDPLYTADELVALGLPPYRPGGHVDAAVVQADHDEYRRLRPVDLPGVRVVLDGRGVLDPAAWPEVTVVALGRGSAPPAGTGHRPTAGNGTALAVEGGTPVRTRSFPAWPVFDGGAVAAATDVLTSGRVNYWTGREGRAFEREFAEYVGARHGLAVANGTVALELALHALGIGPGDEVIVPAATFIATASAVVAVGATPVVVDVDRASQCLSAETVRRGISHRTAAIIVVHMAGWPVDVEPLADLARRHGLWIVEDCAQAHGARRGGRSVGTFGDVAAWSFCQDKIMTTAGEGGAITTDDEALWRRCWERKDHGKSYEAATATTHPPGFRWLHDSFGTNARLSEVQAAVGRVQLTQLPAWVARRRANAARLRDALSDVTGLRLPDPPAGLEHAWYRFWAHVRPEALAPGWDRDRVIAAVAAEGVPCQHGGCTEIHREGAFSTLGGSGGRSGPLPVAAELGRTALVLPVHPTARDADVDDLAAAVRKVMEVATR